VKRVPAALAPADCVALMENPVWCS
jgi:hypothetical protein